MCPSCFDEKIFIGTLKVVDKCPSCGLDIGNMNIGDAAIWFSMFLSSIILGICVLLVEINFHPRFYIHIVIWLPITILFSIIFLRLFKYLFIYLSYKKEE